MPNTFERTHGFGGIKLERTVRVVAIIAAISAVLLVAGIVWQVHRGPVAVRHVGQGGVFQLASGLGTVTVPAGWTARVTTTRTDPASWLEFKVSRTLSRQVVELRPKDGSLVVTLDVVRGPALWRRLLAAVRAQHVVTSEDEAFPLEARAWVWPQELGGRKGVFAASTFLTGQSRDSRSVLFAWDRSAPFILTVDQINGLQGATSVSIPGLALRDALRSFSLRPAGQ